MKRFAITPGLLPSGGDGSALEQLAGRCAALLPDGLDFLLVREKQLGDQELYFATRRLKQALAGSRTRVIVAGRPQVALAANVAGVHVGSDYTRVREARRAFLETWVTASCHGLAEVRAAKAAGVDVLLFGPVFGKTVDGVEVVPGIGLGALREACEIAGKNLPVYALGGVTDADAGECVAAGAAGVAGIRMFFGDLQRFEAANSGEASA